MAIQRYSTYEEVGYPERDGQWVRYADHLADCREREKAACEDAWMECAHWFYENIAKRGVWPAHDEACDESKRRYGEGRGK